MKKFVITIIVVVALTILWLVYRFVQPWLVNLN